MITLEHLKWSNCFSYGPDNTLDLRSSTVTQILGLNGAGKSSIPLIIEEALFNKNSKGIKKVDIPNRAINKGYSIALTFRKDDTEYEVIVDRKTSIKVKLLENSVDISSHTATNTYKSIQDILGLDFKTFTQLVYQNTTSSLQFLTATDTTRKKFLIDLLHLEFYVSLFEVFKDASKEKTLQLNTLTGKLSTIETWLENNNLESTTILPLLKLDINTEQDEELLRSITYEIKNISENNKKIQKNNKYKEMLEGLDTSKLKADGPKEIQSYDHLQARVGKIESQIATSEQLVKKLNKLGYTCPTCEQGIDKTFKLSLLESERHFQEHARRELDKELKDDIERIKRDNREFQARQKLQKDWEDLYRSIDPKLSTTIMDEQKLREREARVRSDLLRAKESLAERQRENERITKNNTRIQVIQEQTEKFLADLEEVSEKLEEVSAIIANLEILKKSFSTNGLLAYKIENLVKELEELVNEYLGELSDGRFGLEFVVTNDKLNVDITDNGAAVDILALSSGELARVNTATLLAIRKLMSSISKSRINVLFLDEVINVLDESGREKLVEVLVAEENLNTYIVSHQWQHPLLDKITVTKENEISRVEV